MAEALFKHLRSHKPAALPPRIDTLKTTEPPANPAKTKRGAGNNTRAMLTCNLTMPKPSEQFLFYLNNIVDPHKSFKGVPDPLALHTVPAKVI